jgi:L-alanine-DL-glutamate epimerase-like enolase superfamily enzyme
MELIIHPFTLDLKYPFGISRHTYQEIETYIVELRDGRLSGFGEATTNPYYEVTGNSLLSSFKKANELIEDQAFADPFELWDVLRPHIGEDTFALSAIDCAAHDLFGKKLGRSFHDFHGIRFRKYPFTSYTLGIDTPEKVLQKAKDLPWPIYKIKAGSPDDIESIRLLRSQTKALIRVDANCAWSLDEAYTLLKDLRKLNIEFVEQPLKADNWRDEPLLYKDNILPLIADESCQNAEDIPKCVQSFHGINIKLSKCGGLTPAIKMIRLARTHSLKVMIGCMTESTVGIGAAAQLLPLADYADLDGPLLLAEDVAKGIKYKEGCIRLSGKPGLGIKFLRGRVKNRFPL